MIDLLFHTIPGWICLTFMAGAVFGMLPYLATQAFEFVADLFEPTPKPSSDLPAYTPRFSTQTRYLTEHDMDALKWIRRRDCMKGLVWAD